MPNRQPARTPRALLELARRLVGSLRRSRSDADLKEELRLHLELAAEHEAENGPATGDAVRRSRLRAGGLAQAMDALRDQRGLPRLDALRADIVFGWRQIVRHRVVSLAAVLSLGLAMGAALAAFRLVDAVLLRPLPVADPSRLFVAVRTMHTVEGTVAERDDFDYPTYRRYVERASPHADVMLVGGAFRRQLTIEPGNLETAIQQFVSGNVFPSLAVAPAIGRVLGEGDDTVPGGHPVAVLSYDYWQRRFGGDPAVLGRTYRAGGRVYTIVGVAARGFTGTMPGAMTDIFVPSMMNPESFTVSGWTWFSIWIRPKPGVELAAVEAVLQAGFRVDQAERAKRFTPGTSQARLDAFNRERLFLQSAGAGASGLQKEFRQPLWILATLAAMLVLIACANVANLLMARATSRTIELALRRSIGAARGRLFQLLLVESALLALAAAGVGALFAWWAAPLVVSMLAPADRPVRLVLDLDWRTLLIATGLTVAVTLLFGLAPALRASAAPLLNALKEIRGQRSHRRLTDGLVTLQTAFCVFLLFGATLFIGTFERLQRRPLGFAPDNLVHINVDHPRQLPIENWHQLAASIRELPRVESAAVAGWAPLTGNRWRSSIVLPGRSTFDIAPQWVSVAPGYVDTMRMRLIEGRDFRAGDQAPDTGDGTRRTPGVAIVNETFARVYFGGKSPVGERAIVESTGVPMEIVGMVADALYYNLREEAHPAVFIPLEPRMGATLLVRTSEMTPDVLQMLRREILRLRPGMVVETIEPFGAIVTQQMIRERLLAALSSFFGALALVLAVVGLYGVLNYAVTRERREIGLRMALGARPEHVVKLVTLRVATMVTVGAAAGIAGGLALSRVVTSLLFEVAPTDLTALAPPVIVLAVAALLAVLAPAVRAVRTDPAQTIRVEG